MAQKLILFICVSCCLFVHAQEKFIDSILSNKTVLLPYYQQPHAGNNNFFLKMDYGKSELLDTIGLYQINGKEILSVDLLFTDYPSTQTLKALNKKRFINLINACPYLFNFKNAQWQVVRQLNGKDKASSEKLLHGFVINYREPFTAQMHQEEMKLIKTFKESIPQRNILSANKNVAETPKKKINYWEVIHGGELTKPRFYYNQPIKAISDKRLVAVEENDTVLRVATKQLIGLAILQSSEQQKYYGKVDTLNVLIAHPIPLKNIIHSAEGTTQKPLPLADSSILKILSRNQWKKILVVADVTLSMAPYTIQLLNWLHTSDQKKNVQMVCCFNDGDDMLNEKKQLNNTGGVYGISFKSIDEVNALVENTMNKGSGGDTPENVCEALLKSINMCKDFDDVILLADNWAAARDIELVTLLHKPVHVLICGGVTGTHTDYLTIAYQTKGSIHFEHDDFFDLSNLKTGMLIRGVQYKVNENGFVEAMRN
jgi:hypothetical protein